MRISTRLRWSLVVLVVAMLGSIWLVLFAMSRTEARLATSKRPPQQTLILPTGCDAEEYRFATQDHGDVPFFELSDDFGDVRGYVFGAAAGRWGSAEQLAPAIRAAIDNATVLAGDFTEPGRSFWHGGYAPGSSQRLGALPDAALLERLEGRFEQCRLGGFWRDMHVSFAGDLIAYCDDRHPTQGDEACQLNSDIGRQAVNRAMPRVSIGQPEDRFEAMRRSRQNDIDDLIAAWLNSDGSALIDRPAFTMDQAARLHADLSKSVPEFHTSFIRIRNRTWLPRMLDLMRGEVPLFVIDARQLPGDQGLLALLVQNGLQIREI